MKKFFTGLMMVLLSASMLNAASNAKWKSMSFTDDLAKGFDELSAHCLAHGVEMPDVLWANRTAEKDIKSGTTLYLPVNRAEMLAVWQHISAWQPESLENTAKVEPTSEVTAVVTTPTEKKSATSPKVTAAVTTPKEKKATATSSKATASVTEPKEKKTATSPKATTAVTEPKEKKSATSPKATTATKEKKSTTLKATTAPKATTKDSKLKTEPKKEKESPASIINKTAKPDKILTAKKKSPQQEISGLMDSVIVLSPNGGYGNGPMRLVISGDKVEVVKLPKDALPKRPSPADINTPFTSGYSYLSLYNAPGKLRRNNNISLNLNSLSGKMMWPVDGKISSPFGRWRGKHKHEGIDIPMPGGTPIRAARNGVVIRTGNNSTIGFRGYGNFAMVEHGGGVRTFYAHCSRVAVVQGQRVMQGQIIGYVGSTGHSTANHLHFEVRINDRKVNPMPYLTGNAQLASHK